MTPLQNNGESLLNSDSATGNCLTVRLSSTGDNGGNAVQNRVQNTLPTVQITAPYQNKVERLVVMLECDTTDHGTLKQRLSDAASGLAGLVALRSVAERTLGRGVRAYERINGGRRHNTPSGAKHRFSSRRNFR